MTLAKTIIYRDVSDVATALKENPPLDEIDEYGYTPLIQTAIVNNAAKADLLLKAGADVNFTDLTGRSALHWAADNNNVELCKLLLEKGANSNAYTRASQPVLVMPLLKEYGTVKKLLYQHGADLNFAQDFINAKLLGHEYSLVGRIDIVDPNGVFTEVEFEGFFLEFSLALVHTSLSDFKNNFSARAWRDYFDKLEIILNALKTASKLIKYQHYLVDVKHEAQKIDRLLNQSPLVIPVAYSGHAITLIKFGNWLIRCDRGEFGREHGTVIVYRIGKPQLLTKAFIKHLIYKRQTRESIDQGLVDALNLQTVATLPLSEQLSGNCSWANVEAVVPALMFILLLREGKSVLTDIKHCENVAMELLDDWIQWDKDRSLYFCIQSMRGASDARAAAKAAILGAILFQQLDYAKRDDVANADKILAVLKESSFQFILKSYVKAFASTKSLEYKNLSYFLDHAGIDIDRLREEDV